MLVFRILVRKFSEITNNKPTFSQYSIFYNYDYFFFQSAFWSLFNHRQRSQSNQEQCSLCCSSPYFRILLYTHYGPLQCFWTYFCKLKWIGVLRSIFRGYVISCNYFNILSTVCRNDWLTFNCRLPSDQETISFNYSSILFNLLLLEVFHQS